MGVRRKKRVIYLVSLSLRPCILTFSATLVHPSAKKTGQISCLEHLASPKGRAQSTFPERTIFTTRQALSHGFQTHLRVHVLIKGGFPGSDSDPVLGFSLAFLSSIEINASYMLPPAIDRCHHRGASHSFMRELILGLDQLVCNLLVAKKIPHTNQPHPRLNPSAKGPPCDAILSDPDTESLLSVDAYRRKRRHFAPVLSVDKPVLLWLLVVT